MSVIGAQTREVLSEWLICELVALQEGQKVICKQECSNRTA